MPFVTYLRNLYTHAHVHVLFRGNDDKPTTGSVPQRDHFDRSSRNPRMAPNFIRVSKLASFRGCHVDCSMKSCFFGKVSAGRIGLATSSRRGGTVQMGVVHSFAPPSCWEGRRDSSRSVGCFATRGWRPPPTRGVSTPRFIGAVEP